MTRFSQDLIIRVLSIAPLAVALAIAVTSTGCGTVPSTVAPPSLSSTIPDSSEDGSVGRGRAIYTVTGGQQTEQPGLLDTALPMHLAASNATTTVTYSNAAATGFTIDVSGFAAGTMSNDILSLGSVAISTLYDNDLKVCGSNGNQKCTKAIIRVYTLGSIAGFVNVADGYGVPVYTGLLNPTSPVGLLAAGAVQVQTLTIPNNKQVVRLSDFPSPSYAVTADFSNAGAGSYSMTYVVEYALSQ